MHVLAWPGLAWDRAARNLGSDHFSALSWHKHIQPVKRSSFATVLFPINGISFFLKDFLQQIYIMALESQYLDDVAEANQNIH